MEEGSRSTGYWCHECSRAVETITEEETIKCSLCHGGFVEELVNVRSDNHHHHHHHHHLSGGTSESDRALSLWAPILLGMMTSNTRRRRIFRETGSDDDNEDRNDSEESELDRELESIMRRRRRSSAAILQLLQGIRAGILTESEHNNNNNSYRERDRDRERERVILINPLNQTVIVHGGGGNAFESNGPPQNNPVGSLGDYFVGPGLELLLQHLSENDRNRYGTPPAQKQAVEAMPNVKIKEDSIQCSICLEDFEVGNEAKMMPCKHRFHSDCILPWLDLHSSCPVCRYQLPSDESNTTGEPEIGSDEEGRNARRVSVSHPWTFNSLFSSSSGWTYNNLFSSSSGGQIANPHLIMNPSSPPGSGSTGGEGEHGGWREDDS